MRYITSLLFTLFTIISVSIASANNTDTSYTDHLVAGDWSPISEVEKILENADQKKLTRRSKDQAKKASVHYLNAIEFMKKSEYSNAVSEFELAMKRYKRAKLGADAMNYVNINMALAYVKTGENKNISKAKRFLDLLSKKATKDNRWAYNTAIAYNLTGNPNKAAEILSEIIKKDRYFFQAYVTLEDIYRLGDNDKSADKVKKMMNIAEEKLINKEYTSSNNTKTNQNLNNITEIGKKPDVKNLNPSKKGKIINYIKKGKDDEKSQSKIEEGVNEYKKGVNFLRKKDFLAAQTHLKNSEKKLKRYIDEDGLNFVRGNLAISYLATQSKKAKGQANRYLRPITSDLFKEHRWTYNMAVTYYEFAYVSARLNKKDGTRKWSSPKPAENLKQSIKLFKKSINLDKFYLPAYENLIYIYREQGDNDKADNLAKKLKKKRLELITSYTKEDQIKNKGEIYIFRLNLGTFGKFDTPAYIKDENHIIAIPVEDGLNSVKRTTYISGKFYNLNDVKKYQETMTSKGYSNTFIVAYKDGEEFDF